MAAISSAQTGNWGTGSTWTGGSVPTVGDTVTIVLGHTVTIDVFHDDTTFANGLGSLTINGSLVASTAAGTYQLRVNGTAVTFGASGELVAGSTGTAYPVTSRFRLKFVHATQHSLSIGTNNAALKLYSAIPTYTYAKTTSLVANGSTVIPLDTDLTTDACWQVGDKVQLVNVGAKAQNTAEYIIQAIGASSITLTVVTSGFTGGLASGSYVVLGTRNVAIEGSGKTNANQRGITGTPTAAGNVARAEWRNMFYARLNENTVSSDYALFVNCASAITIATGQNLPLTVNNAVCVACSAYSFNIFPSIQLTNCLFVGNLGAIVSCNDVSIDTSIVAGNGTFASTCLRIILTNSLIIGNTNGLIYCTDFVANNCAFTSNTGAISYSTGTAIGCTWAGNTNDVWSFDKTRFKLINCTAVTVNAFGSTTTPTSNYIRAVNTTANTDIRTGRSGTVTKITSALPTGYSAGYQATISDVQQPMYWDEPLTADDIDINLKVSLKQSIALTYLKVQVFKAQNDPLLGGTADYEVVLTPAIIGVWEEHTLTISGAGEYTRRVIFATATATASAFVAWAQEPDAYYVSAGLSASVDDGTNLSVEVNS